MILVETNAHFEKAALISGMLRNDQHSFSGLYDVYAANLLGLLIKWVKEK